MPRENGQNTDEYKEYNKKTIKIDDEEKLLLFDNEEATEKDGDFISENELNELREFVYQAVEEVLESITAKTSERKPLYEGWLEEAEYPEGFSIEEFKSLSSFKKRVAYARKHLGRIGGGSARIVFGIDPNTVVKIAMNRKGQAQNEIEADVSNIGYDIIANVEDYDEDSYLYVEMERARKLKRFDWKRITGWYFKEWMNTLSNYIRERRSPNKSKFMFSYPLPDDFEDIEESELFSEIVRMIADFGMPVGDIVRESSWGIVNRNGKDTPVLVDYGLTEDVYKTYYA